MKAPGCTHAEVVAAEVHASHERQHPGVRHRAYRAVAARRRRGRVSSRSARGNVPEAAAAKCRCRDGRGAPRPFVADRRPSVSPPRDLYRAMRRATGPLNCRSASVVRARMPVRRASRLGTRMTVTMAGCAAGHRRDIIKDGRPYIKVYVPVNISMMSL